MSKFIKMETKINDLIIIEPKVFMETYTKMILKI